MCSLGYLSLVLLYKTLQEQHEITSGKIQSIYLLLKYQIKKLLLEITITLERMLQFCRYSI
jgi:hypothetical protein